MITEDEIGEDLTKDFCEKLKKRIIENKDKPEVVDILKKIGLEVLNELPTISSWKRFYYPFFFN